MCMVQAQYLAVLSPLSLRHLYACACACALAFVCCKWNFQKLGTDIYDAWNTGMPRSSLIVILSMNVIWFNWRIRHLSFPVEFICDWCNLCWYRGRFSLGHKVPQVTTLGKSLLIRNLQVCTVINISPDAVTDSRSKRIVHSCVNLFDCRKAVLKKCVTAWAGLA